MKISVIITVYNRTAFLREAIESALVQEPKPEVLVVDDGSDAENCELIEQIVVEFEDIKLIRNSENRGVSAARNLGVRNTTGDFVLFLDDDDLLFEDYFKRIPEMSFASDLILTMAELIGDPNSNRFQRLQKFYNFNRDTFHMNTEHPLYFLAYVPPIHGVLFRKSLFERFQFSEAMTYGEDRLLLMDMQQSGAKISTHDMISCGYRIHEMKSVKESPFEYLKHTRESILLKNYTQRRFIDFQFGYFAIRDKSYLAGLPYLVRSFFSIRVASYLLKLTIALIRK